MYFDAMCAHPEGLGSAAAGPARRRWPQHLPLLDVVLRRRAAGFMTHAGFERWLADGDLVLDIGCGLGHPLEWLAMRHPTVRAIGIDPIWNPLPQVSARLACRAPGRHRFVAGNGTNLPLPGGCVDLACLAFVLHHASYAAQAVLVSEAARVLRPGGTLVVFEDTPSTPGERRWTERSDRLLNAEWRRETHCYRDRTGWRAFIGARGFALAEERPFAHSFPELWPVPHAVMVFRRDGAATKASA